MRSALLVSSHILSYRLFHGDKPSYLSPLSMRDVLILDSTEQRNGIIQ